MNTNDKSLVAIFAKERKQMPPKFTGGEWMYPDFKKKGYSDRETSLICAGLALAFKAVPMDEELEENFYLLYKDIDKLYGTKMAVAFLKQNKAIDIASLSG